MTTTATILLLLLFIKHWYVDFVNQSYNEIVSKKIWGDLPGIWHSIKHGIGSAICVCLFSPVAAVVILILESVIHYIIDWIKMNWGESDMSKSVFWSHFGLDQLAHAVTYISIVWTLTATVL